MAAQKARQAVLQQNKEDKFLSLRRTLAQKKDHSTTRSNKRKTPLKSTDVCIVKNYFVLVKDKHPHTIIIACLGFFSLIELF